MVVHDTKHSSAYTFTAQPKPVMTRKKPMYREPASEGDSEGTPSNIMFDKRVIRGNTYAAQILPTATAPEGAAAVRKSPARRAYQAPGTPEAVEGRRHVDAQTDAYLEELTDTVPEVENATQTDQFMDRPPTPLYIPMKTGTDAESQIEAGELFDFDFEAEPILEVLVGKTLEQGLMEVMEEEELAAMRAHQEHFEQIRNAELVATQRMEAAERRKLEEKERRLAQERERTRREQVVREKGAAQAFARGYLQGLVGTVFEKLHEDGFFFDPVSKEVEEEFMPWLTDATVATVAQASAARAATEAIVEESLKILVTEKETAVAKLQAEKKAAAEAKAAAEVAAIEAAEKAAAAKAEAVKGILHGETAIVSPEVVETAISELKETRPAELPEEEEWIAPEVPDSAILDKLLADGALSQDDIAEKLALAALGDAAFPSQATFVSE